MGINYRAIAEDQDRIERTATNSIRTLSKLYAERSHFVLELLQNAEDALRRRASDWDGSRTVSFHLSTESLRISHYGERFSEDDVKAICSVGESNKELTDIGRFGIGFKSVYAITDRPEIHSGRASFAIDNYVRPVEIQSIDHHPDETVIVIPFMSEDDSIHNEVAAGLEHLGATTLLFLRQIEEIHWHVEGGSSGIYLRDSRNVGENVRRITVVGNEQSQAEIDGEWLVFSRPVSEGDQERTGYVEIAWRIAYDAESETDRLHVLKHSPLVVFFPTMVETHLGFLVQGPYRTTPSRDNVPKSDSWNQSLVRDTASLLVEALRWLRDQDILGADALLTLPLSHVYFGATSRFSPLYERTKEALLTESLLPCLRGGYIAAPSAVLGRTKELRELLSSAQLTTLYEAEMAVEYISDDIAQEKMRDLSNYLTRVLRVKSLSATSFISLLNKKFLENQPDNWICMLYEYLGGQLNLFKNLAGVPLIRLDDGTHVPHVRNGQPQAFLPSDVSTDYPTIRVAVCASDAALKCLCALGLHEPDLIDDVIRNLLPKYRVGSKLKDESEYASDIQRILTAYKTDSKEKRKNLLAALKDTAFVRAYDAMDGAVRLCRPDKLYLARGCIKELFSGVKGVLIVDEACESLAGSEICELIEACGASRHLKIIDCGWQRTGSELRELRIKDEYEQCTREIEVKDQNIEGLEQLLKYIPTLALGPQVERSGLLWSSLVELESRSNSKIFYGTYKWMYRKHREATYEAKFIQILNSACWIPAGDGELVSPGFASFDALNWTSNVHLLSLIKFIPPIAEQLAKEYGIAPGVLSLLDKLGVKSEKELLAIPGIKELLGVSDTDDRASGESKASGVGSKNAKASGGPGGARQAKRDVLGRGRAGGKGGTKEPGKSLKTIRQEFISYVAVQPDEVVPDSEGMDHTARMALESAAIDFIRNNEPAWQKTPENNPGYDLYAEGEVGHTECYCEVKAMTGGLRDRPVGLSRTQFEYAQKYREAYWLYVIEYAGTADARIVRIQDPAGKARTFTFDYGWLEVATVDGE